jgi:protein tyrosine/serine phosphatase
MKIYSTKARTHLVSANLFALSLVVGLISALTVVTGAAQSLNASLSTSSVRIENFGKVGEHYYRGSQPDARQFAELKKLGVKTIIDLRSDRLDRSSQLARGAGMQYLNIPLTTKRPATEEQTAYFLSIVNDPANWPVYVHCKGGRHRTGEMTALYRITHEGWTAEQAYEEMKKYDFEDGFFYPRSLKKYVFSYYGRFAAAKEK